MKKYLSLLLILSLFISITCFPGITNAQTGTLSWDSINDITDADLTAVAYGAGKYVAVGTSGTIVSSTDGVSWKQVHTGEYSTLNGITWAGDMFIVVGEEGVMLKSTDGENWQQVLWCDLGYAAPAYRLFDVAWSGQRIVVLGYNSTISKYDCIVSKDGTKWSCFNYTKESFNSLDYAGENFYGLGNSGILISPDGGNFIKNIDPAEKLHSVASIGDLFVAVGDSGLILPPVKGGLEFIHLPYGSKRATTENLNGITASDELFVAVGDKGTVLGSPDGVKWTKYNTGTSQNLKSIIWADNIFVGVGDNGTVITGTKKEIVITKISLNNKNLIINIGEAKGLVASTSPAEASQGLIWSSSDDSIATVDDNGMVKGIKGGKVRITAAAPNGDISDYCDIVVNGSSIKPTAITSGIQCKADTVYSVVKTTVTKRSLPESVRNFSNIRVMTSNKAFNVKTLGLPSPMYGVDPYYSPNYFTRVPGKGTWYVLVILFDKPDHPIGYMETQVKVTGDK